MNTVTCMHPYKYKVNVKRSHERQNIPQNVLNVKNVMNSFFPIIKILSQILKFYLKSEDLNN